jgi:hypothetical protein
MMNPDQQQQLQAHLHNSSNQPKHHQIQQSKEHHHNLHHNQHNQQQHHNDGDHHQHHNSHHHQAHHSSIHPGEPTFAAAVAASLHHSNNSNNNESSSANNNNPSSLSSLHAISQGTAAAGNTNSNSSPAALLGNPLTNPPAGGGLGMPVQLSSSSLQSNNNAGSGPPPLIPNPNLMFHQQPQGGIGGQGGDLRGGDYNDPNNNNNIDLLSKGFQDSSFMMNPSPYPGSHLPHLNPHLPPHQGGGHPPPPFHPSYLHQPNFHHGMFYNPPPHGLGDPNTPPLFNPSLVGGMRGSPDHLAMNGMNLSGMNPHAHLGSVGGMDHGSNQFPPSFFNYGAPPPPPPGHDGFHPQGHDPATMHFLFAPSSHMNEFTPGIGLTSGSHGESSSNVLNEYK